MAETTRGCVPCKGTGYQQVKTKPGKSWTNVTCGECGGSGRVKA